MLDRLAIAVDDDLALGRHAGIEPGQSAPAQEREDKGRNGDAPDPDFAIGRFPA